MSKQNQTTKNLKLTQKLLDYIVFNSQSLPKYITNNNTYVVFSNKDKKLNEMNTILIQEMKSEGKKVIKAKETGDKLNPWIFAQA